MVLADKPRQIIDDRLQGCAFLNSERFGHFYSFGSMRLTAFQLRQVGQDVLQTALKPPDARFSGSNKAEPFGSELVAGSPFDAKLTLLADKFMKTIGWLNSEMFRRVMQTDQLADPQPHKRFRGIVSKLLAIELNAPHHARNRNR